MTLVISLSQNQRCNWVFDERTPILSPKMTVPGWDQRWRGIINKFFLPSLLKEDEVPITNFLSKLLLNCTKLIFKALTPPWFACLLDTKVGKDGGVFKSQFSDQWIWRNSLYWSARRGSGAGGEAEPDLIKGIKWPYTSDSKEQSPWESQILLVLIKCTILLR